LTAAAVNGLPLKAHGIAVRLAKLQCMNVPETYLTVRLRTVIASGVVAIIPAFSPENVSW